MEHLRKEENLGNKPNVTLVHYIHWYHKEGQNQLFITSNSEMWILKLTNLGTICEIHVMDGHLGIKYVCKRFLNEILKN